MDISRFMENLAFIPAVLSWCLAAVVLRARWKDRAAWFAALLLLLDGMVPAIIFLEGRDSAHERFPALLDALSYLGPIAMGALPAAYLLFLSTLDSRLVVPFRSTAAQLALTMLVVLGGAVGFLSYEDADWLAIWIISANFLVAVFALAITIPLWRRTRGKNGQKETRALALAFITRDFGWAFFIAGAGLSLSFLPSILSEETASMMLDAMGVVWISILAVGAALLTYAVIIHHALGVKLSRTAYRAILSAFFVLSFAGLQGALSALLKGVGGPITSAIAVALLPLFLKPFQAWSEVLTRKLFGNPAETGKPAGLYDAYVRMDIYRSALAPAMGPDGVPAPSRAILESLRTRLSIGIADAELLEASLQE